MMHQMEVAPAAPAAETGAVQDDQANEGRWHEGRSNREATWPCKYERLIKVEFNNWLRLEPSASIPDPSVLVTMHLTRLVLKLRMLSHTGSTLGPSTGRPAITPLTLSRSRTFLTSIKAPSVANWANLPLRGSGKPSTRGTQRPQARSRVTLG